MSFRAMLLVVPFLLAGIGGFAQSKLMERADRLFEEMSYPQALEAYAKVVKENRKNRRATVQLATCYRLTGDYRNAQRWYAQAVKMKGIRPPVWFEYGQVLMRNRKYEAAIPWFEKYQQAMPEDARTSEMIAACQNYKSFATHARLYRIRKLKVNSAYSDFGPAFYGNKVVFASSRKRQLKKYNRTGQSFLDLYIVDYSGKPALEEPELFRGKVNTPYHEATACFSRDGQEMYFTRNHYAPGNKGTNKKGVVTLATFQAKMVDGKWEKPVALPFNNADYSVGHPCLSPDGKRLYFVSNMPGGKGGTDLYFAEREGESWGEPVSMGKEINTEGDEMFPWMDEKGDLYFASNGRAGLGGLDIYQAEFREGAVATITNMGAPINSPRDDFSLIYRAADGVGFFTSNRPGTKGDDDLWAFTKLIPLLGFVRDEADQPVVDATVTVLTGRSALRLSADAAGQFIYGLGTGQKCKLVIDKEGFVKQEVQINAAELVRDQENVKVIVLKKAAE